jgi:hypothetical protein
VAASISVKLTTDWPVAKVAREKVKRIVRVVLVIFITV